MYVFKSKDKKWIEQFFLELGVRTNIPEDGQMDLVLYEDYARLIGVVKGEQEYVVFVPIENYLLWQKGKRVLNVVEADAVTCGINTFGIVRDLRKFLRQKKNGVVFLGEAYSFIRRRGYVISKEAFIFLVKGLGILSNARVGGRVLPVIVGFGEMRIKPEPKSL